MLWVLQGLSGFLQTAECLVHGYAWPPGSSARDTTELTCLLLSRAGFHAGLCIYEAWTKGMILTNLAWHYSPTPQPYVHERRPEHVCA